MFEITLTHPRSQVARELGFYSTDEQAAPRFVVMSQGGRLDRWKAVEAFDSEAEAQTEAQTFIETQNTPLVPQAGLSGDGVMTAPRVCCRKRGSFDGAGDEGGPQTLNSSDALVRVGSGRTSGTHTRGLEGSAAISSPFIAGLAELDREIRVNGRAAVMFPALKGVA